MTDQINFFIPLSKVDKEKRTVSGYASTPTKDSDGEVITLDAVKKALPGYMSWSNIREMHRLSAVGTAQEAHVDEKGLFLTAKIVDEKAWQKCVEGVYKGFSIGGRKLAKTGDTITEIDLTEISIVDRPANPDAKFSLAKKRTDPEASHGFLVLTKQVRTPAEKALIKMAKANSALAKLSNPPAAHDGFSLPAKTSQVVDSPKDPAPKAKAKPEKTAEQIEAKKLKKEAKLKAKAEKKTKKAQKVVELTKVLTPLGKLPAPSVQEGPQSSSPSFLDLKAVPLFKSDPALGFLDLKKGMRAAGDLSYVFDSLRNTQRSLLMEAKREGGDGKDKELAKQLGQIAKQVAGIIGQKAEHEGGEAIDLSDADDLYVNSFLGEDFMMTEQNDNLTKALQTLLKAGKAPSKVQRMAMMKKSMDEAKTCRKRAKKSIAEAHEMHKAAYLSKVAKAAKKPGEEDLEFDHAGAMEKLQKAFSELEKMKTFEKAAAGQLAKMAGVGLESGEAGLYEVPPGVKTMSMESMAGANPGTPGSTGLPPMYPGDGSMYPGKADSSGDLAKFAKNGLVPLELVSMFQKNAQMEGELAALRRMPVTSGNRRPFAFDMTKVFDIDGSGNPAMNREATSTLFKGVDPAMLASQDEGQHTTATAQVIGNLLTSGQFGKSIMSADFKGAAGGRG